MRTFTLLLSCLALSTTLLAQEADLAVVSAALDRNAAVTGEPLVLTAQVRNNGPAAARDVVITFGSNLGLFPLSLAAPAGWTCQRLMSVPNAASCTIASMAVGVTADFSVAALAPTNTASGPVTANVLAWTTTVDPNFDNNNRMVPLTLNASATTADLAVTVTPRDRPAVPGQPTVVDVTVANRGPNTANDVVVAIDTQAAPEPISMTSISSAWNCTPTAGSALICRRSGITANNSSTLSLRFTAPAQEAAFSIFARVQAQRNRDQVASNDFTFSPVLIGSAGNWSRILLPQTATNIPGANGSLWKTDLTALVRSTVEVPIEPTPCQVVITCLPQPLGVPYDAGIYAYDQSTPSGQFIYVPRDDESKVRLNARVYDQTRSAETAGAEIPIVRDHEFRSSVVLVGIPVAPEYRHTLRVYDDQGLDDEFVVINLYADDETAPRLSRVATLRRVRDERVTSALLPLYPAYLQVDVGQLLPLGGIELLRVEIEPVDPGARLWGFVTITNNDTHHVTTVSPQ